MSDDDVTTSAVAAREPAENNDVSGEQFHRGDQIQGGEQISGGAAQAVDVSDHENDDRGHSHKTASSSARRPVAFQSGHALKFGLEVVAREAAPPGRVTAVLCLFCKHFGREPKAGAKRRATTNFKYFKGVFRTDQYLQHHRLQHPVKWAEYDAASVREKQTFFPRYLMAAANPSETERSVTVSGDAAGDEALSETPAKPVKKLRRSDVAEEKDARHGDAKRREGDPDSATAFEIPAEIAALLFGDERWEPLSLPSCERVQAGTDTDPGHRGEALLVGLVPRAAELKDVYRGTLLDRLSFDTAVGLCATGLSTAQATRALQAMATYVPNGAVLASVWGDLLANYSQVATLGSLTLLSGLLASSWAFSIGFHRRGNSEQTVDVRVRFSDSKICEFHLCCLRVDEVSEKLVQVLTIVCPSWQQTLTGVSIAGDVFASAALTPAIRSLRSTAATQHTLWVTWNGNELLRRAVVQLFHQLQGGSFAKGFRDLKAYVKSQSRLVQEIGHEVQLRSGSAGSGDETVEQIVATSRWFSDKRVRIRKYFEEESGTTSSRPSEAWWLCLAIFDWIATPAEQVMHDIRARLGGLVPSEQLALIQELQNDVSTAFRVGPLSSEGIDPTANTIRYMSTQRTQAATKTGVLEFIVELGSFVNSLLTSFGHDELDATLESLGVTTATFVETLKTGLLSGQEFAKLCGGTGSLDVKNVGFGSLLAPPPPVLPQELVKLNGKALSALLAQYKTQLLTRFTEEDLDTVEQEHQALKRAIREKEFRAWTSETPVLDRLGQFDGAWLKTTGRFRMLHAFAGGLASVLPWCDASARDYLACEDASASLPVTTLAMEMEAPLHAAQFHELRRMWRLLPAAI